MNRQINVIVIDDSAFMRKSLSIMLESDPEIKVIATAHNGRDGIEKIRTLKPDLVTLDIEMPVMDGLTALGIIMKEMPLPVLMVSSLTTEGAQSTLDALALGAVDFIPKELSFVSLDIVKIKEELLLKVKEIVRSRSLTFRLQRIRESTSHITSASPIPKARQTWKSEQSKIQKKNYKALVIGISTGGPMALLQLIPKIPANFPLGIAIVQHMPPRFTHSMAARLDGLSQVHVKEAENGDLLEAGNVLIAPGGQHLLFEHSGSQIRARISDTPRDTLYRPCADVMMKSVVEAINAPLIGLIMTGMGKDGLEGLKQIKKKGGIVVAQDEETCVVYGMPKAAVDEKVADLVVPLPEISNSLISLVGL
jgi:two-component system chemotaxis response regulator CheB